MTTACDAYCCACLHVFLASLVATAPEGGANEQEGPKSTIYLKEWILASCMVVLRGGEA